MARPTYDSYAPLGKDLSTACRGRLVWWPELTCAALRTCEADFNITQIGREE